MSKFSKLSHVIWHCQYHIVWVPKYRYRVLKDRVTFELGKSIRVYSERLCCELVELNIQPVSIFEGKTALGQSFLDERVLCGHGGCRCGNDLPICETSGKA